MEITPRELRDLEIHSEIRGYNRDEVNDLLERAAAAIESGNERVAQLQERLSSAQSDASRSRETEDILHRTLLLAQRAADEAVTEASARSRQMLDDAETQSRRLVAEAEVEARRNGESERNRLENEVLDLAGRRDTLLADIEALTNFEAEYRERVMRALEADLSTVRDRQTAAPGKMPEPSDVEIPLPAEGIARPDAAPDAEDAAVADPETTEVRDDGDGDAPDAAVETSDAATREVDVQSLFESARPERANGQSAPPDAVAASEAPSSTSDTAAGNGAGLHSVEVLDTGDNGAEALDDDAFFATLREAVHDDAPLGPRDENEVTGEHALFDQDADRSSFRDVFRRRR